MLRLLSYSEEALSTEDEVSKYPLISFKFVSCCVNTVDTIDVTVFPFFAMQKYNKIVDNIEVTLD